MGGITHYYSDGQAELHRLLAGNDILSVPLMFQLLLLQSKKHYADNRISEEEIDAHVKKIFTY